MTIPKYDIIRQVMDDKGYLFLNAHHAVNLIAIRTSGEDQLHVIRHDGYERIQLVFDIDTKPGKHWLLNPFGIFGEEILPAGQYLKRWKISAIGLRQIGSGRIGAHIISANPIRRALGINYYPAPLQVLKNDKDMDTILYLCDQHIKNRHGRLFTYTILNENDFA